MTKKAIRLLAGGGAKIGGTLASVILGAPRLPHEHDESSDRNTVAPDPLMKRWRATATRTLELWTHG